MKNRPDADLLAAVRPWRDRAAGLVARRLSDALTHAAAGNLPTAEARLSELYGSLSRHVSDARGTFYRQAFRQHQPALDPAVHQLGLGPTADGETRRGMPRSWGDRMTLISATWSRTRGPPCSRPAWPSRAAVPTLRTCRTGPRSTPADHGPGQSGAVG